MLCTVDNKKFIRCQTISMAAACPQPTPWHTLRIHRECSAVNFVSWLGDVLCDFSGRARVWLRRASDNLGLVDDSDGLGGLGAGICSRSDVPRAHCRAVVPEAHCRCAKSPLPGCYAESYSRSVVPCMLCRELHPACCAEAYSRSAVPRATPGLLCCELPVSQSVSHFAVRATPCLLCRLSLELFAPKPSPGYPIAHGWHLSFCRCESAEIVAVNSRRPENKSASEATCMLVCVPNWLTPPIHESRSD